MNSIKWSRVENEIGASGVSQVKDLATWLHGPGFSHDGFSSRFAPSIITRGEAEVFNVSTPRFAIRVYMDGGGSGSFANLRRIETMRGQVLEWAPRTAREGFKRPGVSRDEIAAKLREPSSLLARNTCIADCLISSPIRTKGFHVLESELGHVYGESKGIYGTPYMRHIDITGGGLCAQAVCFMAATLLHDMAGAVHGTVDITALGKGTPYHEMPLTGLDYVGVSHYFASSSVGFSAEMQVVDVENYSDDVKLDRWRQLLRSYVLSGFPVVLPMDLGRAAGDWGSCAYRYSEESIFKSNFWSANSPELVNGPSKYSYRHGSEMPHAVLLVGCGLGEFEDMFLINDPASFPFLKASAGQLWDSMIYSGVRRKKLAGQWFIPVTHGNIRLPLSKWYSAGMFMGKHVIGGSSPGLLGLAFTMQNGQSPKPYGFPPVVCERQLAYHPGEFRLVELADSGSVTKLEQIPFDLVLGSDAQRIAGHWCWVQYNNDCREGSEKVEGIWVWDAEEEPPEERGLTSQTAGRHLLAVLLRRKGVWEQVFGSIPLRVKYEGEALRIDSDQEAPDEPASGDGRELGRSLITSFSVLGIDDSLANWPDELRYADLYVFMQSDAEQILRPIVESKRERDEKRGIASGSKGDISSNAEDLMAELYADDESVLECARIINDKFRKRGKPLELVALSTFLPSFASHHAPLRKKSIAALGFAAQMAVVLKQEFDHPIQAIEMVAGSRLDGAWPAMVDEVPLDITRESGWMGRQWRRLKASLRRFGKGEGEAAGYVANLMDPRRAIKRFVNRLGSVAPILKGSGIAIAVELEPGPNFLLGSPRALTLFCEMLDRNEDVCDIVGLNLDVAHWILAGFKPEDFDPVNGKIAMSGEGPVDFEKIYNRIVHIHISDHSRGHFADLRLATFNEVEIRKWIEILNVLSNNVDYGGERRSDMLPGFSRFVSLEIEAVKDIQDIEDSLRWI